MMLNLENILLQFIDYPYSSLVQYSVTVQMYSITFVKFFLQFISIVHYGTHTSQRSSVTSQRSSVTFQRSSVTFHCNFLCEHIKHRSFVHDRFRMGLIFFSSENMAENRTQSGKTSNNL